MPTTKYPTPEDVRHLAGTWEVCSQDIDGDEAHPGPGWEPFAVSEGPGYSSPHSVVWWRKWTPEEPPAGGSDEDNEEDPEPGSEDSYTSQMRAVGHDLTLECDITKDRTWAGQAHCAIHGVWFRFYDEEEPPLCPVAEAVMDAFKEPPYEDFWGKD